MAAACSISTRRGMASGSCCRRRAAGQLTLVAGGVPVSEVDRGYGPVRYLTAAEVRASSAHLQATTWESLASHYDPGKMSSADIYPLIWARAMRPLTTSGSTTRLWSRSSLRRRVPEMPSSCGSGECGPRSRGQDDALVPPVIDRHRADTPALLLSGYATRPLRHALTRRSQTCHRVPLKTARHAPP